MAECAQEKSYWAGCPMPLDGERLVIEPRYPFAEALSGLGAAEDTPANGTRIRNTFWSWKYRSEIVIMEDPEGQITWGLIPGANHVGMDLGTLGCADAWGLEQELTALDTMRDVVSDRQFKQYMLTSSFLETSPRSQVSYLFRRLRPTLAMRPGKDDQMRSLAALCLHPIAYYAGTWAGAMCPTDDVLAHLMLMRGDEHLFWRRANQHAAYRPEAGL